ncbi:hypothetical protein BGZ59_011125 [Podila verticillata]|nr:hypothetical protein BGZ59_011125 [Podila verticillata]
MGLDSMELPWINSFYRMMIHRVANCFQLERRIDTTQKTITLYRTDQSALPAFRFVDIHHEEAEEEEGEEEGEEEEETPVLTPTATTVKPIKVLKRCPPRPASVCGGRSSSSSRADDSNQRTVSIKEREEAYAKARARIFQGTEVSHSPSLSSSSSSSPRPQLSRSKTVAEPANETNTDETSTVVGSDNGTVMASPMSPGSSTTYHHDGSFSVHQRGRSSDTSDNIYTHLTTALLLAKRPTQSMASYQRHHHRLNTKDLHDKVTMALEHIQWISIRALVCIMRDTLLIWDR